MSPILLPLNYIHLKEVEKKLKFEITQNSNLKCSILVDSREVWMIVDGVNVDGGVVLLKNATGVVETSIGVDIVA